MEGIRFEADGRHLLVGDLDLLGVAPLVQDATYLQPGGRSRVGDELDDRGVGHQRLPSPVVTDEREEAMLDLVPLAGPRWEVGHTNVQSGGVGQALKFPLPQSDAATITATTVGDNEERRSPRVGPSPHLLPPTADGMHREGCRIMVDAHGHPALIEAEVIHAVRDRLALRGIDEVVYANPLRTPPRTPFPPAVFEVPHQLLLLGVDRDRRLPAPELADHPGIDIPKLRIAIRMPGALLGLAIRLQTVSQIVQQLPDQPITRLMALRHQLVGKQPRTLAGPPQGRLGIAPAHRIDQLFQCRAQARIDRRRLLAPTAGSANTPLFAPRFTLGLFHAPHDRAPRDADRSHHQRGPAITKGLRFRRCPKPTRPLVQRMLEHPILSPNHLKLGHTSSIAQTPRCVTYYLARPKIVTERDDRTTPDHFDPEVLEIFRGKHEIFRQIFDSHPELDL